MRIGFVILSHSNPDQVLRLSRILNYQYDNPPIVCHHDMSQSKINIEHFTPNVFFIDPSIATQWAKISIITAEKIALKKLYELADPDWFFLLSGQDYPLRTGRDVRNDLANLQCDALIDIHQLHQGDSKAYIRGKTNQYLSHLKSQWQQDEKRRFYLMSQLSIPIIRRKPSWRLGRATLYLPLESRSPYNREFRLYYGDHWFAANRRAAKVILEENIMHDKLMRHLRWRFAPDETFYQTVLGNKQGLIIDRDTRRFFEWDGGGAHPKIITPEYLPRALASGAYFGRKFANDARVLDRVDEHLLAFNK